MSVEDFNEHKRRRRTKDTGLATSWLKAVYNPKIFRRKIKGNAKQTGIPQSAEYKVMAYLGVLVVLIVFILVYAVLRKNGLVD